VKYDLQTMLEEIKEDEKVFEGRENYWASQDEIARLVEEMHTNDKQTGKDS